MQVRAILEAAGELIKEGKKAFPEIMIPVTCTVNELDNQKAIVDRVYSRSAARSSDSRRFRIMYGTMIEIPRAALTAGQDGRDRRVLLLRHQRPHPDGLRVFSRDDIGSFLPDYLDDKILPADPFQTIDQEGIGELIQMGIERGRSDPAEPQGRHLRRARRRCRTR